MVYRVLADLTILAHVCFVAFAVPGGFLALSWRRCAWVHLPSVLWAALIEFAGWRCPLTPLADGALRRAPSRVQIHRGGRFGVAAQRPAPAGSSVGGSAGRRSVSVGPTAGAASSTRHPKARKVRVARRAARAA